MSDFVPPKNVIAHDIEGNTHEVRTGDLRWRPSVYGIMVQDNNVLVLPQYGKYDLPGGGVEFGEHLEDALGREVREETGFDIGAPKLLEAVSSFYKMPNAKEDFIQSIMMYYACKITGGELTDEGFDEFERIHVEMARWFPVKDLELIRLSSSVDWRPFVRAAADGSRIA